MTLFYLLPWFFAPHCFCFVSYSFSALSILIEHVIQFYFFSFLSMSIIVCIFLVLVVVLKFVIFIHNNTKATSNNTVSLHRWCRYLISSVQLLSHVRLFGTPWTAAHQASLSVTNSLSLLKLMSIGLVMPSNHLILCHPLLLLPSIFPSIRVFSNESALRIRWPKY